MGKSTLSLAMALRLARAGRRVLVVSSHPLAELAVGISLAGLGARFPEAAQGLFVVYIDPVEQISALVQKHFPLALMARSVLNSSIFQNLIAVAPGLKEFFFLARLQQLAERRSPEEVGAPAYDDLIWDAPATGHFLSTLRAARGFDTYLSGPLAAAGAEMHRFFSAPGNLRVIAVTQAEEMAIAETLELSSALQKDFSIRPSVVALNAVSPLCMADAASVAELSAGGTAGGIPPGTTDAALRFAIDRGCAERDLGQKLATDLPVPQVFIPRIAHRDGAQADSDLLLLAELGTHLERPEFS